MVLSDCAFIGVREKVDTFVLSRRFHAHKGEHAVLRATALGLYFAELNGQRVGDSYLTPGWTSYNKMLQVQEYDVTPLLREGENELSLTVNTGWYCGRLTFESKTCFYGERSAVCAELIVGGERIATDESWQARESFIRASGIYDGETQDFTAPCAPLTPCAVPFEASVLVPQICESVRTVQELPVRRVIRTPKGELVYDFGQNIAGVVRLVTPPGFSGTLTLRFAEILVDGNFYTDNLRSALATDVFTLSGARTLSPEFTFHGFRYMKLEGAELPAASVTALVRHTDMARTGHIRTDNARFQRLYENVVWGQRGNFLDIPTDCPQRDERLGWTGDINVFCRTAAYNFDVRGILKKWLADLRNDQAADGRVPHVVPHCLNDGNLATDALWADAVTMVPWTLYEMYGDISFLSDNYAAMCAFLAARERTTEGGLVARGHEYGDWLAMDQEKLMGDTPLGRTESYFITNVFFSESLRIAARTARLLGKREDAARFSSRRASLLRAMRAEYFTPHGRLAVDTVTAQVLALHFHIVRGRDRARLAAQLNENVKRRCYRMTTGFAGAPYVLFALADNGYFETARRVLFNSGYPGWLYEVDMGATTVWERWNSLMPDGTPNPNGMNSYNHYAYGSVMGFVWRRIAGIEPRGAGFAGVALSPRPCRGLPEFYAEYDSVRGKIVSSYRQRGASVVYHLEVPAHVGAVITLPGEAPLRVRGGTYEFERPCEDLREAPFTPENTVRDVFDNPKALRAFNEAFGGFFYEKEIGWMCRGEPKTLQFMAQFRDGEKKMKLADFPRMLARANEIFLKE